VRSGGAATVPNCRDPKPFSESAETWNCCPEIEKGEASAPPAVNPGQAPVAASDGTAMTAKRRQVLLEMGWAIPRAVPSHHRW
jgi:hypothetical protein